jgi:hypothetical protein
MNLVVRRRLAAGALVASSALVAGVLLAPSSNAAANALSVTPSGAFNSDTAKKLTFTGSDADFEFGGTATFTRIGGGQAFPATIGGTTPPVAVTHSGSATVDFTDVGDNGVGSDGPADAGTYSVSATGADSPVPNPVRPGGGTDSCSSCFTVNPAGIIAISSVAPGSIRPGNAANITITGANFERGTQIDFLFRDGSVDPLITANKGPNDTSSPPKETLKGITTNKQMLRRATVASTDAPGARGVRVTNLDGQFASCTECFFVSGPALSSISPTSAANDPGTAGCRPAATPLCTVTMNGPNVTPNGVPRLEFVGNPGSSTKDALSLDAVSQTQSNGSSVSGDFNILDAAPGPYQAVVRDPASGITNACEQPACAAFTVVQAQEPPRVTNLDDPNRAGTQHDQPPGTTKIFDVNGANFSKGVIIKTSATGVTVTAVEFVSRTLVRATIVTASTATANDYDVTAVLTDGSTSAACAKCYTVGTAQSTASPSPSATATATVSPCPSASASTSAPASATPTASTSASPSSSSSCGQTPLTISVSPKDIVPKQASTVSVHGAPNQPVDLYAYSQPNTDYSVVRSGTTDASGNVSWSVTPGGNTRLYAHYRNGSTTAAPSDSKSIVITVHTSLSLSAYRDGPREYHFQGTNLPRRAGQLITLYRYATGPNLDKYCVPTAESDTTNKADGSCHAIITSQADTGPNNTWRIDRTFTGDGKFYFVVRTSQNINNGRGHSNQRLTIIH